MYLLRLDQIQYCKDIEVFIKPKDEFILYKRAGVNPGTPAEFSIHQVYISEHDRDKVITRMQDDFSHDLTTAVKECKPNEIKRLMLTMMENALVLPNPTILQAVKKPFILFVDVVIEYP